MAVSRPYLIALAAAVVMMGVLVGMRAAGGGDEESSATEANLPAESSVAGQARTVEPAAEAPAGGTAETSGETPAEAVPGRVARALASDRVVVLFFSQGAADDVATRDAVRSVRGRGIAVFSDDVERLADYAGVVGELRITRAPAVVVIAADGEATVEEGFLDSETLEQRVRDARR